MESKRRRYGLMRALARVNGEFIPAEKLVWVIVTSWDPHEYKYNTWEEANIARIEMQKKDNNFYYKVL